VRLWRGSTWEITFPAYGANQMSEMRGIHQAQALRGTADVVIIGSMTSPPTLADLLSNIGHRLGAALDADAELRAEVTAVWRQLLGPAVPREWTPTASIDAPSGSDETDETGAYETEKPLPEGYSAASTDEAAGEIASFVPSDDFFAATEEIASQVFQWEPTPAPPPPPVDLARPADLNAFASFITGGGLTQNLLRSSTSTGPISAVKGRLARSTDPAMIQARAILKARACRLAAECERQGALPTEWSRAFQSLERDAKLLLRCTLWMARPRASAFDADEWLQCAQAYQNLAEATTLLNETLRAERIPKGTLQRSLELAAESQAILRAMLTLLPATAGNLGREDVDQVEVFHWVKDMATEHSVFLHRYMRRDDLGDPARGSDLAARLASAQSGVEHTQYLQRTTAQWLQQLSQDVAAAISGSECPSASLQQQLNESVEGLARLGWPLTRTEIRDRLIPLITAWPVLLATQQIDARQLAIVSPGPLHEALLNTSQFLAEQAVQAESGRDPEENAPPTPAVARVAAWLRGRTLVLIGGDLQARRIKAVEQAFDLGRLEWIETREHQSISGFESVVARADTAVVCVALRWAGHAYSGVKEYCNTYNKAYVLLRAGLNPNQIAHGIVEQCSAFMTEETEAEK
jgi:hypothetical protein